MAEKLTKSLIDSLPLVTDGNQTTVMDTVTPGFGLRVGSSSKTFIVVKRMPHGNPKRVTLGKYGALTLDTARKMALEALAQLSKGLDPNAEKKTAKLEQRATVIAAKKEAADDRQTLQWLFDEYQTVQLIDNNGGSAGTLASMNDCFKMFGARTCQTLSFDPKKKEWSEAEVVELPDWLERPLRTITAGEVLERFEVMEITRPAKLIGGKLAPMVRTHQVAYKFAQSAFEFFIPRNYHESDKKELLENPFKILKVFNKWKAVGRRTRIVDFQDVEEFGRWWETIEQYRSVAPVPADYMQYSILQAGRSIEIVSMTWDMVDFKKNQVRYEKTKNGEDYVIPLSRRALEILHRRKADNPKSSKWVWHYPDSETGHVPKDMTHHFHRLEEYGGKYVSAHDLKRTWASAASSVPEFKERDIDYLLKHIRRDVGAHYYMKNRRVLETIVQTVEDMFLGLHAQHMKTGEADAVKKSTTA